MKSIELVGREQLAALSNMDGYFCAAQKVIKEQDTLIRSVSSLLDKSKDVSAQLAIDNVLVNNH